MSSSTVSISIRRRGRLGTTSGPASSSHFELAERLVQIWIRNRRDLNRLGELEDRLDWTSRLLASSTPSRRIVEAHRERLLSQRWEILRRLRADERLAEVLMGEIEARRRASEGGALASTA